MRRRGEYSLIRTHNVNRIQFRNAHTNTRTHRCQVSLIGLGGWHLGFKQIDEELSIRIIRTAIDSGINFMDNCWDYNEGASEIRMGKALKDGYRDRVLLMTKIDGRTKQDAAKQLDESLRRMQTDHIDLVQHHEILRLKIRIESSTIKARMQHYLKRAMPERLVTSVLPDTRILASTCTRSKSLRKTVFSLTPCRCR